jgi:hypothetical protein
VEDAILKEVWAAKDRIAARYRGNIKKFMRDLRKAEEKRLAAKAGSRKSGSKRKSA